MNQFNFDDNDIPDSANRILDNINKEKIERVRLKKVLNSKSKDKSKEKTKNKSKSKDKNP